MILTPKLRSVQYFPEPCIVLIHDHTQTEPFPGVHVVLAEIVKDVSRGDRANLGKLSTFE